MNGENEAVRLNAAVDDDHDDGEDDGKENLVQFQNKQAIKLDHFLHSVILCATTTRGTSK